MTLREIDRQFKHWRLAPPAAFTLTRIGREFGLEPPGNDSHVDVAPTSEDQLRAMAMQFGVNVPEARHVE